ncbi:DNA polymerase III subunit alpha [Salisediminibacterium selenitireducens]|uniref:DNA polymerase III subunit alpha n=1 Tax=Bacillus selenitireducens (strain ATCC 700615 / DSM 15326 / MLS10) TaxID=439292 RepID=D6XSS0_BACIE|nr:DNA polymerase III subunit alpha [Salisediminibacterium selenitireducens]ADH98856.1 DNA polymerase III, alpha subunit [[Bacillus] selenitireducens MLS10]
MAYAHLHVHTEFSLLSSLIRIDDLTEQASSQGFTALAMTDLNNIYGAVSFYRACRARGIKPILGVELSMERLSLNSGRDVPTSLLLYAKSFRGYQSLVRLVTMACAREAEPYVTMDELEAEGEELVVISPFSEGRMQLLAEEGRDEEASAFLKTIRNVFGEEDVYVEIQNHWLRWERERMQRIRKWLTNERVPVVATNHVHALEPDQFGALQTLQAIKDGVRIEEIDESLRAPDMYLKNEEEMREQFAKWNTALDVTEEIVAKCEVELPLGGQILPSYPVSDGETAASLLRNWCEKGLYERYHAPEEKHRERLEKELQVIHDMGYEDYFLIVADFMDYAHRNGILTGPGRGSAAGSLVAYLLRITDVDPILYDLLFERFLNPERVSMPDIDIDFSDLDRDQVIHYVHERYGASKVAQIVTFGTLAAKAALRDTARVLGIPTADVDRLSKLIPARPNMTITAALEEAPAFNKAIREMPKGDLLLKTALDIEGIARHTSIHAAGVVMSKDPLTDIVPLQPSNDGLTITQFPMGDLEDLGLLKMDFLGLRNLSFMERIAETVKEKTGEALDLTRLPLEDERMFALLGKGETNGIFQLESQGMRRVLKQLKPERFEDIVAVNALYRPGPMEQIPLYIRRKNGEEPVTYPHEDLREILAPTYGVMIYQEQIMQIASKMAGFSLAEADMLRRAVSKKKKEELERSRTLFVEGAVGRGYAEDEATRVYELIERFANYGFNRSHAVAYSMISCRLAWLKTVHPEAFMAALMEQSVHAPDKLVRYIAEAKQMGLRVSGPSVQRSSRRFTVNNGEIVMALQVIRHTGHHAAAEIIRAREEEGPFGSLFDFCKRVSLKIVSRKTVESLIMAGAMDDFGVDRTSLFASLEDAFQFGDEDAEGFSLFEQEEGEPDYRQGGRMTLMDKLDEEREVMGFYLSGHPVEDDLELLKTYKRQSILEAMGVASEKMTVRLAGMIEHIRLIRTKKGDQMAFVSMSDETGAMDITVFPEQLKHYQMALKKNGLIFTEGKMQWRNDAWNLILDKAVSLETLRSRVKEEAQPTLYIRFSHAQEKEGVPNKVEALLQDTPGEVPVVLKFESTGEVRKLSELWNVKVDESLLLKLEGLLGKKNLFFRPSRV